MCSKTFKNCIRLYPWLSTEPYPIRSQCGGVDGSVPAPGTDSLHCGQSTFIPTWPYPLSGCLMPVCVVCLRVVSPSRRFCKAWHKSGLRLCPCTPVCDLVLCLLSSLLPPFSFPLYFLMLFTTSLAIVQHSDLSVPLLINPNDFSCSGFLSTQLNLHFGK